MLLDHFEVRSNHHAPAESADGELDRQRFDEHAQPHGWTAAAHAETDAFFSQQSHRAHARIGQPLIRSDERSVDIRDDK
jgi:hypothetical protein